MLKFHSEIARYVFQISFFFNQTFIAYYDFIRSRLEIIPKELYEHIPEVKLNVSDTSNKMVTFICRGRKKNLIYFFIKE